MSKDFFSVIASELCSIKNSPFRMIGDIDSDQIFVENSSHLLKSKKLSYNPDRLLNPDKYRQQQSDPDFYEMERQINKENMEKIQIQFLKEKTQEELRILKQKIEHSKGQSFTHPYSIFKVDRTVCQSCNRCYEYQGNFNIGSSVRFNNTFEQTEYLCCLKCSCPMNSHAVYSSKNRFSCQIFTHLSSIILQAEQLNYQYFPLCFLKKQSASINTIMSNFLNYLPQLGFEIISSKLVSKKEFQIFHIKKQILTGIQKDTVQKLLSFVAFLENEEGWSWKQQLSEDIDKSQFHIIKKIKENLKISQYLDEQDQAIFFYVRNQNKFDHFELVSILNHYQSILGSNFIWGPRQVKQMFLSSCLLFPEHFTLNHQIFMLPSMNDEHETQKVRARFKDILDYNNYTVIGQIKQIQKTKLESILKFQDPNKVDYRLGREQLNSNFVNRVRIQLTAKVGPPVFTIPFKNAIDFIEISSDQKKSPFMLAFPEYLRSQRCVLILRPCFTLSNFDEIIMTLLRVNNFVLLKRRQLILSNQQARYLATLQKIQERSIEAYVKMMTSGASQIVLVSKRGAIYQANVLLNGSKDTISDTKTKIIKDLPVLNLKRGTQSYEYIPIIKAYQYEKNTCFGSINELFRLQNILFPQEIAESKLITNAKTGEIIKIESIKKGFKQLKATSKLKESILAEIKKDTFNYWTFASKSQFLTEELAAIFMPETTLFQSCVVIVKPGFVHLHQKIKQALFEHRYHIIMEKTVMLSRTLAAGMISNLQKTNTSDKNLRKYVEAYCNENIHIFCLSKVFAKQEMFSIMSQFTFLSQRSSIVTDYVDDDILKQALIPVWNNQQFVLKILSAPLYNLQEAVISLFTPNITKQDKKGILTYFIGSYYGVSIKDQFLSSVIGRFSYYITTSQVANLQSWFYSQLSKQSARYVPTLFQHRQIGETCFIIQSYSGQPFLQLISRQYKEEKQKIKEVINKQERKSLILFLWGRLMAKFVNNISQKKPNMKGLGKLIKRDDVWRGQFSQNQLFERENIFLEQCEARFQNKSWQIHLNVQKVINSRYLNQKYKDQSKRKLIPWFTKGELDECIRIIKTEEISKLHLVDKYSMIDPEHQKNNHQSLYTLNLYNIEPSIGTKQELIVEIMIFLNKMERNNSQYAQMFQTLFQYFVQHVLESTEADLIECEYYVSLLKQYVHNGEDQWVKQKLTVYPNLKKLATSNSMSNDQVSGKKRKFLQKKQYYRQKHTNLTEQQKNFKNKQYRNFNLNYEYEQKQFDKTNPLLNMEDPLHKKFAFQQRTISLLREQELNSKAKTGIYVQFQKKISQNEQLLINKVKGQVDKFNYTKQEKILYQNGLQNQLWYRKTKGQSIVPKQTKVQDALKKQIAKFMEFKKTQKDQ